MPRLPANLVFSALGPDRSVAVASALASGDGASPPQVFPPDAAGRRRLLRRLRGRQCVVHDSAALAELLSEPSLVRHARPVLSSLVDSREFAALLIPCARRHDLPGLAGIAGYPKPGPANPADLASATAALCVHLAQRVTQLDPRLLSLMLMLVGADSWPQWLRPSNVRPAATSLPNLLAPIGPRGRLRSAAPENLPPLSQLPNILGPDGPLARAHPAYEHRPGQIEMALAVAEALRKGQLLMVEAGTGVGKSLAYLVPAILWSLSRRQRVAVSTNTKNLQEQLADKDLPLVREILAVDFHAVVLKGRNNYACARALSAVISDLLGSMFRAERLAAAFLLSWIAQSQRGDLSEISPEAYATFEPLADLVEEIRSDAEACGGRRCSHHGVCCFERLRRRAQGADLVVVNHALALADLEGALVPQCDHIIFDEAHNLEDVATDQLGHEVTHWTFTSLLRRVRAPSTRSDTAGTGGLLRTVRRRLERAGWQTRTALEPLLEGFAPRAAALRERTEEFGDQIVDFVLGEVVRAGEDTDRATLRLTDELLGSRYFELLRKQAQQIVDAASELARQAAQLGEALEKVEDQEVSGDGALAADFKAFATQVTDAANTVQLVLLRDDLSEDFVRWIEAWETGHGPGWALRAAPIDVGPVLEAAVYRARSTVVFTSATLTVEHSFEFFRQRLGLERQPERLAELSVPSPFDLPEQLLLCVPRDVPLPTDTEFVDAVVAVIAETARLAGGRTLALFTSRSMLRQAVAQLAPLCADHDVRLLVQDRAASRSALLNEFQRDERTVLCGVKSFWEGVDVPGVALSALVIVKLPFAVPSDPLVEARREHLDNLGRNSRDEYYIPQAIIGFKQGFGRLIRSRTDRGVVVVLDKRLLLRNYGRRFFRSLERCALERGTWEECLGAAEAWLSR